MTTPLVLIAAVGRNGAIGRAGGLPWRLAGDMRHFRQSTMGRPLILGRRTWQSIGRPLPGRSLVIVSKAPLHGLPADAVQSRDPEAAVAEAQRIASARGADALMVGGGAAIYAALIGRADRLEVTEVDLSPPADAFMPPIDPALWRKVSHRPQPPLAGDDASYAFATYLRR